MTSPVVPLTRLRNRGVLQLAGRDTYDFLHAMTTCNAKALPRDTTALAYAAFLNAKGRMLYDAVLHPQPGAAEPTVLLEMDRTFIPEAIDHLKEYKLRKKVKFEDRSEHLAVVVGSSSSSIVSEADPRPPVASLLGMKRGLLDVNAAATDASDDTVAYRDAIFSIGVGDGADVFSTGKSIPFDGNLDGLEGVSFHKGCYVGQELTHRTHIMLVVRKRLVPFELVGGAGNDGVDVASLVGKSIDSSSNKVSCGRITAWGAKHGVGLFRLGNFVNQPEGTVFSIAGGDGKAPVEVRPRIPEWWPDEFMEKVREEAAKQ